MSGEVMSGFCAVTQDTFNSGHVINCLSLKFTNAMPSNSFLLEATQSQDTAIKREGQSFGSFQLHKQVRHQLSYKSHPCTTFSVFDHKTTLYTDAFFAEVLVSASALIAHLKSQQIIVWSIS